MTDIVITAAKRSPVGSFMGAFGAVPAHELGRQVIEAALKYVPKERIVAGTNCGMAPMRCDIAAAKLEALGKGAALARQRFG